VTEHDFGVAMGVTHKNIRLIAFVGIEWGY